MSYVITNVGFVQIMENLESCGIFYFPSLENHGSEGHAKLWKKKCPWQKDTLTNEKKWKCQKQAHIVCIIMLHVCYIYMYTVYNHT